MDRRLFFKNLLGGVAALAVAPSLYAQIEEADYINPKTKKILDPQEVFSKGDGFWVFKDKKLVAWAPSSGAILNIHNPIVASTSFMEPYFHYFPGKPEGSFGVENLTTLIPETELMEDTLEIVMRSDKMNMTISSEAYMTRCMWRDMSNRSEAHFTLLGATTLNLEKG